MMETAQQRSTTERVLRRARGRLFVASPEDADLPATRASGEPLRKDLCVEAADDSWDGLNPAREDRLR